MSEREPQDMRGIEPDDELLATINYVKSHARYSRFQDGSLCLHLGDGGMDTDLVFSAGAMDDSDPLLERQRLLLRAVVRMLNPEPDQMKTYLVTADDVDAAMENYAQEAAAKMNSKERREWNQRQYERLAALAPASPSAPGLVAALRDAHRDMDFLSSFVPDEVLHSHLIPAQKRIENALAGEPTGPEGFVETKGENND